MYSQKSIKDFFALKKIILFCENEESVKKIKINLTALSSKYEIIFTDELDEVIKDKNFLLITNMCENADFKRNYIIKIREKNKWSPIVLITSEKKFTSYNFLFLKNFYIIDNNNDIDNFIEKVIKTYTTERKSELFNYLHRFFVDIASKFTEYFYVFTDNKGNIIEISDSYYKFINLEKSKILNRNYIYFIRNKACIKKIQDELKINKFVSTFECCFYDPINKCSKSLLISIYFLEEEDIYLAIIFDSNFRNKEIIQQSIYTYKSTMEYISSYLHDEISPLLAYIKMNVESSCISADEKNKLLKHINDVNRKIREISNELSYKVIDNYGLTYALTKIIELKKQYIKNVKYEILIDNKRYSQTIENAIYRICVELLNNTIKHANAENVEIKIKEIDNKIILIYSDDGVGFDIESKLKEDINTDKQGLLNIINLIRINKGYYKFKNLNKGYSFKIEIPICS